MTEQARRISTGLTLGDVIETNAQRHGEQPAFVFEGRTITHRRFAERVHRLASAFARRGARRQDRIAILSMNSLEYFEVYGAAERAGFILATVNYRLAPPEALQAIANAAPHILVFEAQYASLVERLRPQLAGIRCFVCIGGPASDAEGAEDYEALLAGGDAGGPPWCSGEDDIAHLIHTSGTTGRPKGCMLDHRALACKAQMHAAEMAITPQDRVLLVMPLFHVGAKSIQTAAHWRAATVYLHRGFDAAAVLQSIDAHRITIAHLAPTLVQALLEHPLAETLDLASLRLLVYSAAPMPVAVLRRGLKRLGPVFHQSYGQTEGMVSNLLRSQHRPDGSEKERRWLTSVGQAATGVDVRIVDGDGADCPLGEAGEIVYRGGCMLRGYWNDSVATVETLRDGWVHSGDIGRLDEDGFLYLVDRKKDMIVSGGENIYSIEVEEAIVSHEGVAEAAVIGMPSERWGETVCAIVVPRAGCRPSAEELIAHCRERIASYKKPTQVRFTDALPRLVSGKVDKAALRRLHGGPAALR